MAEPEESRTKAVTVIGWLWVVLGVLYLLRALVNMILWKILKPDMLGFLETFAGVPPAQQRFLRPLFEHLGALQTIEATLSAAVIVIAFDSCVFARGPAWACKWSAGSSSRP